MNIHSESAQWFIITGLIGLHAALLFYLNYNFIVKETYYGLFQILNLTCAKFIAIYSNLLFLLISSYSICLNLAHEENLVLETGL